MPFVSNKNMKKILCIFWIGVLISVDSYRLPTDVIPEHYKLEILTHLGEADNFSVDGKVWIEAICLHSTKNITLHSKNLEIDKKQLSVKDVSSKEQNVLEIDKVEEDKKNDFLIIYLENSLSEDHKYEIYIPFKAQLLDGLSGFYRSSYIDKKNNEKKWLGVTQFEAISARKAFPCFDEPAMKATFEISLGRKDSFHTISNMPIYQTEPIKEKEGWSWDRFENSVPMSTYLVAFIVSDFGYKTSKPSANNNVTFKIWARKDALDQVELAKEIGPKFLDYFEQFFNISYPLPKQDMVAIPDFSAGAMENWGLVTYREAYLLYDPEISSSTSQHNVASVIAHELAHQWFGNLVTMKWWTDLWLNEGFATYMSELAVDHLFPQWNTLNEEAANNLINVFSFDALKTSHPVSVPIGHPNEIDEIFDTISYKKGSFLIRMMSLFLGMDTLKKGVSNYLLKHKYGNAEQDDLWESLTSEAHKNGVLLNNLTVKTVMDTWTLQTGYPIITVTRNYGKNTAEITQERYFKDEIKTKGDVECWWIPLSYTDGEKPNFNETMPKEWMSCPKEVKVITDMPDNNTWVIFNIQVSGLYRVNYDEKNWNLISKTLQSEQFNTIPVLNRVQIIEDTADLAWMGHLKYDMFFNILKYLKYEDEYLPWDAALININYLTRQLRKTSAYGNFKNYMKKLLTPIYEKLGGLVLSKTNVNKLDLIKHKSLIVNWACKFEVANCEADAIEYMKQWQSNPKGPNPIPKDFRKYIYCAALRKGGEKEWEFIWNQYNNSNVATEKNSILSALGCTRELWLLNRYLEWSVNEQSGIRRQDSFTVFGSVVSNDVGYFLAKDFLFNQIGNIHKHLSENSEKLTRYLKSMARQMNSDADYNEINNFVQSNKKYLNDIKQGVDQTLETVRLNNQWQKRHQKELKTILDKYSERE